MLGARPPPVAEKGSATREKIRRIGHGSVIDDYIFDRTDVEVASSHTPPEDRQARLSDVGRGYHGAKRCYLVTSTKKQPKTSYFDLLSAAFLYIFHKIGCFQLTTCLPYFFAFYWIFHCFFSILLKIPFLCFLRCKF